MCPQGNICSCITIAFMAKILACGFKKEGCPFIKKQEPHGRQEIYTNSSIPARDAVIVQSGSSLFLDSGLGIVIGKLPNGDKIYDVRPGQINAKLTFVDSGTKKETTIDLSKPGEN